LPDGQGEVAIGEKPGNLSGDGCGFQGELKAGWQRKGGPLTANHRWTWAYKDVYSSYYTRNENAHVFHHR
jgi:hypothetical protein